MNERKLVNYHLLCLAQVDILLVLASWLTLFDVHDADEGHGAAPQQQDGEKDNDNSSGANKLSLLNGFQTEVKAQGVGDSTP